MDIAVEQAARKIAPDGLVDEFLAIIAVETSGAPWWTLSDGRRVLVMRPEPHRFYANLTGAARDLATASGLAAPKAGIVSVPGQADARYALLERMCAIDREAAYRACSWGLGQIMGENAVSLGYPSAVDMVERMGKSVENQLDAMAAYARRFGVIAAMRAHDWAAVARIWNGPGYAANAYDKRLAEAYSTYSRAPAGIASASGQSETSIAILQRNLQTLGYYPGEIDGIAGKQTDVALRAFQEAHGLKADGVAGALTQQALVGALAEKSKTTAVKRAPWKAAIAGGAASLASAGVQPILDTMDQVRAARDQAGSFAASWGLTGSVAVSLIAAPIVGLVVWTAIRRVRAHG